MDGNSADTQDEWEVIEESEVQCMTIFDVTCVAHHEMTAAQIHYQTFIFMIL